MNFAERRKQVFEKMERQSALILFSGIESHVSADEYAPFEADRNFFYLTGLRRDHMILLMKKTLKEEQVILFIEEADRDGQTIEAFFNPIHMPLPPRSFQSLCHILQSILILLPFQIWKPRTQPAERLRR